MSLYPIVAEQDMIDLAKLAEKQKTHRAIKYTNRISQQTHDKKIGRAFEIHNEKIGRGRQMYGKKTKN